MQSQVVYSFTKRNKLEYVKYHVSDSENMIVLFNKGGQVHKIERYKNNNLHGFNYYFTNNKLDSIQVYNMGVKTPELYIMGHDGHLIKHLLPNGADLDSFFSFTDRKNSTGATSKHWINMQKIYQTDSSGALCKIYDTDNGNYPTGYDISISNGYYLNKIANQPGPETLIFSEGYIVGFYTSKVGILHGVRILFNGDKKTTIKELDITADNKAIFETTYFNKRGKKENHLP